MADHETRTIPVANLLLDVENPRHAIVDSQIETIHAMVEKLNEKLLRLAEDIVDAGTNPSEIPIVIPSPNNDNLYIVLEGNRRVAALKILEEPSSLLPSTTPKSLRQGFKNLSPTYCANPVEVLLCAVLPDRESANRWINLKHTGENQGVGVVPWGAIEVDRFHERQGKKSPELQVIDFVKHNSKLDSETRKKVDSIAITNLKRLIRDRYVKDFLGISIVDGNVQTGLAKREVLKGLTRIIKDLARKEINVNNIRSQTDRANYVEKFDATDVPDASKQTEKSWHIESDKEEPLKKGGAKKGRRSKPVSSRRNRLIPSNCIIRINDRRINGIYRELKSLPLEDHPNAGAVLLRVFFEMSIDSYIDRLDLSVNPGSKLSIKVQAVIKHLQDNKILSSSQLKPANVAISDPNSLFSIATFHAYVHNRHLYPKPNGLKDAWDEMQTFMEKLWT